MASCPAFFSASRPPYTFASFNAFLLTRAVVYAVAVIRPLALFVPLTGPWPTLGVLHAPRSREFFFRFTRLSHSQRFPLLYVVCVRPFVARFYTLCAFVLWLHALRSRVFLSLLHACRIRSVSRFYTLCAFVLLLHAFIRCLSRLAVGTLFSLWRLACSLLFHLLHLQRLCVSAFLSFAVALPLCASLSCG